MPQEHRVFLECPDDQLSELASEFAQRQQRSISEIHLHHSVRPDQGEFEYLSKKYGESQAAQQILAEMLRQHTQTIGLKDIAQHVTIDPRGTIWLCRSWNEPPASATGFNGNAVLGPLMVELIGNFEREALSDRQRDSLVLVIASIQRAFRLPAAAFRLHSELSSSRCPGSRLDRNTLLNQIKSAHSNFSPSEPKSKQPFPPRSRAVMKLLDAVTARVDGRDPPDAELPESDRGGGDRQQFREMGERTARDNARRNAAIVRDLELHLVNLRQGRFSEDGLATSSTATVAKLCQAVGQWIDGRPKSEKPVNIVFYAHGGLTSEQAALETAHNQYRWWLDNGIYPIFFIWETGIVETTLQLIDQVIGRERDRGILAETADSATEWIVRTAGRPFWDTMKGSAERAFDQLPERGGTEFLNRFSAMLAANAHKDRVRVHCVGHSAGAVFHAHLLAAAAPITGSLGSIHLLAPACTTSLFDKKMKPIVQSPAAPKLTIYTMDRAHELMDSCADLYHKSLLYLVSRGFERDNPAPILGLEESIRADATLARFLGEGGVASPQCDVIWSPTGQAEPGLRASATSHGGFDNDKDTMESIVVRIAPSLKVPFPEEAQRGLAAELLYTPFERQPGYATHFRDFPEERSVHRPIRRHAGRSRGHWRRDSLATWIGALHRDQ